MKEKAQEGELSSQGMKKQSPSVVPNGHREVLESHFILAKPSLHTQGYSTKEAD